MKDEHEKLKELSKWQTNDSFEKQLKLAYPKLKADVQEALKDSGKKEGYVYSLSHQFKDKIYLTEWYGKGYDKIFTRISKFQPGKENDRTVILEPT